jgi:hypothetical protein
MAKKALGIEIKEFLKDGFPEGFIHDFDESGDSDLELEEVLIDEEVYDLSDSMFGWLVLEDDDLVKKTFSQALSAWKRKTAVSYLLVEVPKNKLDEAKTKIIELGYKIKG